MRFLPHIIQDTMAQFTPKELAIVLLLYFPPLFPQLPLLLLLLLLQHLLKCFLFVIPPSGSCDEILATHHPRHHYSVKPQGVSHCLPPLLPSSFSSSSSLPHTLASCLMFSIVIPHIRELR